MQEKSRWLFWLNVVGLSLLFVLLQWNSFTMPFERDEGEYAYSAWMMTEGQVPYRDTFLQKPPMIIYTYYVSQLINPDSVWPPRALGSLASLLTAILIGLIARNLYGSRAGWLALWVYLPLSMLPIFLPYAANTEKFLLLPLIASLYLRLTRGPHARWWEWVTMGVLGGTAALYKPTALVPLVIIILFWAIETGRSDRRTIALVRKVLMAGAGGVAVTVLTIAWFAYQGVLRDLVESTITFNYFYAQVGGKRLEFFASMIVFLAEQWWILIPLVGWYVYKRPAHWLEITALFVASLLIASTDLNGHYYLMMIPFLAIMVSSGLDSFLNWLPVKIKDVTAQRRLGWLFPAVVVLFVIFPLRGVIPLHPDELSEMVYWGNPFVESSIVAKHLDRLTAENERVFVAGSEPQILFLAKRMNVTRFDIVYPLTMPTPFMRQFVAEAESTIVKSPPRIVVYSLTQMSWFYQTDEHPEFRYFVERMLRSGEYDIVGGYMRNGKQKGWVEPLKDSEVRLCTLIILKRKESKQ